MLGAYRLHDAYEVQGVHFESENVSTALESEPGGVVDRSQTGTIKAEATITMEMEDIERRVSEK